MIKRIIFILVIIIGLNGCTRDDICSEGTPTTPLLIITFKDGANPTEGKTVPNLTIETADLNNTTVITQVTTDSLSIPLNTGADTAVFRFKKDDGGENPNTDIVTFIYSRQDIYVNRACGFKTIYDDLSVELQDEGTANWIYSIQVLKQLIENEEQAHITILH